MAEVISHRPVLSDSMYKTRPDVKTVLLTDANSNLNLMEQIERRRRERHMKFPKLTGRTDVESFVQSCHQHPACKRYTDAGDSRAAAPNRDAASIVDPVSGFVSAGGDVDRNTGHQRIEPMTLINTTPQAVAPQRIHSVRTGMRGAPPSTRRLTEWESGAPYRWNSRKMPDSAMKAQLGGWTSERDPRKVEFPEEANHLRDKLALKYTYTSSTQRAYEDVPWDDMLPPRRWTAPVTLEERPDMISQKWEGHKQRYDPTTKEWQKTGPSWDWFQTREGYYKQNVPIPGIDFCSPCPRAQHLPLYGGSVGGANLQEIDNRDVQFTPLTVKRVQLPRPTDTAHRPNIPGYGGCTIYRSVSVPAHTHTPPETKTSSDVHRTLPTTPNTSEFKKDSQMSKMVTTVPPHNPFNSVEKEEVLP